MSQSVQALKNPQKEAKRVLIGEYYHNLDVKGRVSIPSKFRDDLGGSFVLSRGLDDCLYMHSAAEWDNFKTEIDAMHGKEGRIVKRFFYSGATECEIDSQGRVVVPPIFREFAKLDKEVVIVGVSTHAELWDRKKWEDYKKDSTFDGEQIANIMDDIGF